MGTFIATLLLSYIAAFAYVFSKDKDPRKLLFIIVFFFGILSQIPFIVPEWSSLQVLPNLEIWSALAQVSGIITTLISAIIGEKEFKKSFKLFLIIVAICSVNIVVPFQINFSIFPIYITLSMLMIGLSSFLIIKKKTLPNLMFLLTTIFYIIAEFGLNTQWLTPETIVLAFLSAHIFMALIFMTSKGENKEGIGHFFSYKIELEKTKKELRNNQEKLEKSAEMMKLFFEFAPDPIYFSDLSGTFIDGNRAAEKLTGYKREELIGNNFFELKLLSKKQLVKAAKLLALNALGKETGPDEFTLKSKDGMEVILEISTHPLKLENKSVVIGIARNITEKKILQMKLQNYAKDLEEQVLKRTEALNESRQELQVYSNHLEEIVEERSKKLKASERLAAIGQAATMVGHDLRNPLQAIQNAHYFIEKQLKELDSNNPIFQQSLRMLQVIDDSIEYANNIVLDLREFATDRKPECTIVNINNIIDESLSLCKLPKNVEIIKELAQTPQLELDKAMIKRVIVNIVSNGVQAMPDGGIMKISTKKENAFVKVSFKDTGLGISEETMKKLFTPFFTTKAQGMGMGLAICKKFVELNGGFIEVESEESKGSKFIIKLPC